MPPHESVGSDRAGARGAGASVGLPIPRDGWHAGRSSGLEEGVLGTVRLADLLAALSLTTDLAMGQPPEKAIRATAIAVELARELGLPEPDVADVYYATLLKHLGCTATAHEEASLFGPDGLGLRRIAERTDVANTRELAAMLAATGRGAGLGRPRYVARAVMAGRRENETILRAVCEVGAHLARRLELGAGVERALFESLERWDGKGEPRGLRGEEIAVAARIAEPAT